MKERVTGRSRGFAFVTSTSSAAVEASFAQARACHSREAVQSDCRAQDAANRRGANAAAERIAHTQRQQRQQSNLWRSSQSPSRHRAPKKEKKRKSKSTRRILSRVAVSSDAAAGQVGRSNPLTARTVAMPSRMRRHFRSLSFPLLPLLQRGRQRQTRSRKKHRDALTHSCDR